MYDFSEAVDWEQIVCGRSLGQCMRMIEDFHGFPAPGLALGLFMVDRARKRVGEDVEADAIVETRHCLPDAVQLFTPCTAGNGWMKIVDRDKFALTLYDRRRLNGFRVCLDLSKARNYPDLYHWYMRLAPKRELPLERVLNAVFQAGWSVLSERAVTVVSGAERIKKADTVVCARCG